MRMATITFKCPNCYELIEIGALELPEVLEKETTVQCSKCNNDIKIKLESTVCSQCGDNPIYPWLAEVNIQRLCLDCHKNNLSKGQALDENPTEYL